MKKIFYGLIILLFGINLGTLRAQGGNWSDYAATSFDAGTGSSTSPYIIATPGQLAYLAKQVRDNPAGMKGKYFKLKNTIDMNVYYWDLPIGNETNPFEGIFDGNKYTIDRLSVYPTLNYSGLFGKTNNATVKDVTVTRGASSLTRKDYVGGLIGYAQNTVVTNCTTTTAVLGENYVGGLIGYASSCTVSGCRFSGKYNVMGLNNVGGLIGYVGTQTTITDCRSEEGKIIGTDYVGGLIGYLNPQKTTSITDCSSTCFVSGNGRVGGFIGYSQMFGTTQDMVTIKNCYAAGTVYGMYNYVGGFMGSCGKGVSVTGCYASGMVTGLSDYVGGFSGSAYGYDNHLTTISNCHSSCIVAGSMDVGGFVGQLHVTIIAENNYCTGSVVGTVRVGGFVGTMSGNSAIARCFTSNSAEGERDIGGFVGFCYPGNQSVNDCYACGTVTGTDHVSGFVGYNSGTPFTRCYATGATTGKTNVGGFYGSSSGSYSNCYFDKQGTGLTAGMGTGTASGITGLAAAALTANSLSGFSTNTWVFTPGYYPQLKTFAQNADASIKSQSALSAVSLQPANETELCSNLQTVFRFPNNTPTGSALTLTVESSDRISILDNVVYADASDNWRTLTLHADNCERIIKFRSEKGLSDVAIKNVKVNGTMYNSIGSTNSYLIECGSTSDIMLMEIDLFPFASCSPGSPILLHANTPQEITVTAVDGKTKTYVFVAEKLLPSDEIFEQRWKDVLAVNNNFATNGGHIFTGYEWYKDGNKLPSTKGYIQEPGGLSKTAKYTAGLTTQQGDKIGTCPATITASAVKMAAWPNPAQRGQTVRADTGIPTEALSGTVVQLFGPSGNIVAKQNLHDPVAEIAMPDTPGQYLLQVTTADGAKQTFKIAVE